MVEVLLAVGDFILAIAALGGVVFAVSYSSFFAWRKTPAGKALMYFVLSLIAVFINNAAARLFGVDYPLREWARIAVYLPVAITMWRLVAVLWTSGRRGSGLDLKPKQRVGPPE